jgi:7-cyano-7-deazaguanine reductase
MAEKDSGGMLLGQNTPVMEAYAPHILHAIPRKTARAELSLDKNKPFYGTDQWHAYEMSWLDQAGKPEVRVGRFRVPAHSPNMVESKSFKLYLNSLNNTRFATAEEAHKTIVDDLSTVAGEAVVLELWTVDDPVLTGAALTGSCLDSLAVNPRSGAPHQKQLQIERGHSVEETVYSHLLRSLCPVTGQPDWATLWIHYRGTQITHNSLLEYIISYRDHREFHEQCAERMFLDLQQRSEPEFLHLQAFYTRRGGLDISPFRSTEPDALPLSRLARQ